MTGTFKEVAGIASAFPFPHVLMFEGQRTGLGPFFFNRRPVDGEESYKYLGISCHQEHGIWRSQLVLAARKAMHAMHRRCAALRLSNSN